MKMIETRELTDDAIAFIEKLSPKELEAKYRYGDYLVIFGISFKMVFYSMASLETGESNVVTWWSELYDVEIEVDRVTQKVKVEECVIDHRADGF